MTAVQERISADKFDSVNPATGEVVGTFPIHNADDVREAVSRARKASVWWRDLGYDGRKERLLAWKGVIARRADELIDLIHAENGKPRVDAITVEVVMSLEHLNWAARRAGRVLRRRYYVPNALAFNHLPMKEYEPLGVIGVIGPWNYPVFTPMGSVAYALAAGNSVVFKPSEHTPAIGQWLVDAFALAVPEQPVLQLVTGFGETGAALCTSGVDKVAFTGSSKTGRKVMAACAETLTPVVIEGGGKDAFLVAADADLDRAAGAAAFGAFSNSGQTCAGVESVYVVESVYQEFLDKLVDVARTLRPGSDPEADYGPITIPAQIDLIQRHLADAFDRGARAVVGGPEAVDPPYIHPVVLVDVPEDALILHEETFGPVLPVARVRDLEEGLERAGAGMYGLGAAIFSRSRGMEAARGLHTGMVAINDFAVSATHPALPWGGVGASGFGRIHGEDGLKEFVRAKAIMRKLYPTPSQFRFSEYPRPTYAADQLLKVARFIHGRH
jgi:succinate-semialdehyde dehydrogenase / glutarate-semialdehyde dehydrogenase